MSPADAKKALAEAWAKLIKASEDIYYRPCEESHRLLHQAAMDYSAAWWTSRTAPGQPPTAPAARPPAAPATLPRFGPAAGKAIGSVETKLLSWYLKVLRESISDPTKSRWAEDNKRVARAIETELEFRP